jgi:hypothetical protein
MAIITSAQSGNFNATTTWVGGAVPVDNDSFVIATGHTVTYNVSTPVTTGFDDSDVYGILQTQSGAATVLRMNGRLRVRTNGTYHARAGHKLQFRGTAVSSHILYLLEEAGASLIMEGSDGMPTTTLSAGANEGATSFSFTSATNFAAGEWFAIYDHTTAQTGNAGSTTLRDEGFWVHDISANTVYFRQFVGPESTISSAVGSTITVANAKVFRAGQKIIFGTGANLNVKTISTINYSTNVITCDSAITGTVTGLTVYETGSDKIHTTGNKVRKVATVTTTSSTSTSSAITVANANMFVAGDEIWIEAKSECGGTTDRAFNAYGTDAGPRYRHVVLSVSSNTITLNATIGYNVVSGALVTRLTRDVIVEPVTANTDYYGVWAGFFSTNYTRKLIIKDVFFRHVGSSQGQPEGGVSFRGYFSTNAPAVTLTNTVPAWNQQSWLEGITLTGSNSTRDLGGLWNYSNRYGQFRCCTVVGIFNSGIVPGWYDAGNAAYNCISAGSNSWGYRVEHLAEWGEFAYNYLSRSYYGCRLMNYEGNCGFHHNIMDAITEGPYSVTMSNIPLYKFKVTGGYYGPIAERCTTQFLYSIIRSVSGIPNVFAATPGTYQRGFYHTQADRGDQSFFFVTSVEDNMEIDRVRQFVYGTERFWDLTENAWRVVNAADFTDAGRGWYQTVYVPPNVTLIARGSIKLAPSFVGTYPSFTIYSSQSGTTSNQLGNAGGSWSSPLSGGNQFSQFTAAASNSYETRELTLTPKPFHRWVQVGVWDANVDAQEGWWMKPIEVFLSSDYTNPAAAVVNMGPGHIWENYNVSNSAVQNIVRIGGRIR